MSVAGFQAPSLLEGRVINFVPSGVSPPVTIAQQTSGTNLTFGGSSDDGSQLVDSGTTPALPFSFPFFGTNRSSLYVNINGNLTFTSSDSTFNFTNQNLLDRPRIAALATDLIIAGGSKVFTNTLSLGGGKKAFVITYEKMGQFNSGLGQLNTFQIVLFDTGAIQFNYFEVNNAKSTTESEFYVSVSGQIPKFDEPRGIWGNSTHLYVGEQGEDGSGNNAIRRVTIATGEVTTLAGTGFENFADLTSTSAAFNDPRGVAGDGQGNLYVADRDNNRIRKIVIATGEVTTLAGSATADFIDNETGSAARFDGPRDLWVVGGDLYVTDQFNHAIRKVVIATGEVETIAGTGASGHDNGPGASATFDRP